MAATLYLIPTIISEDSNKNLPTQTIEIIHNLKHFVVERARTTRRFIKTTNPPYKISDLEILEIQEDNSHLAELKELFAKKISFGILSEAGMPGIADPGANIVKLAHQYAYTVKPLVGPSSILLALAASGMNGQNFRFLGYLPIKAEQLVKKLKSIEQTLKREDQAQIFIEAPYRNDSLLKTILTKVNSNLNLCIASNLTGKTESVITKTIKDWNTNIPTIGKIPTIFILGR